MRALRPSESAALRHVADGFRQGASRVRTGSLAASLRARAQQLEDALDALPVKEEFRTVIDPDSPAGTLTGHLTVTPLELAGVDISDPGSLRTLAGDIEDLAATGQALHEAGWTVEVNTLVGSPSIHFTLQLTDHTDAQDAADQAALTIPLAWRGQDASAGVLVADHPDQAAYWPGQPLIVNDLLAGAQTPVEDLHAAARVVTDALAAQEHAIRQVGELDHDTAQTINGWRDELADHQVRDWYGLRATIENAPAIIHVTSVASARARGYQSALEGRPERTEEDGLLAIAYHEGIQHAHSTR